MPKASREMYIEIPAEDRLPNDGDVVGRLNREMYGFRTASNSWMADWQALLKTEEYDIGIANPALFKSKAKHGRGAVHGDDFYVLGTRATLDDMSEVLKSKYNVRESHRLGFSDHCAKTAHVLNRVVSLGLDRNGRRYVDIEPDARHVDLIIRDLG